MMKNGRRLHHRPPEVISPRCCRFLIIREKAFWLSSLALGLRKPRPVAPPGQAHVVVERHMCLHLRKTELPMDSGVHFRILKT
jgi:hypothetical protein